MSLILYMLNRAPHWGGTVNSSTSNQQIQPRNRLQKSPRNRKSRKDFYACPDLFDVVRAQSCLTVFTDEENEMTIREKSHDTKKRRQHVGFLLKESPSRLSDSNDSLSVYSTDDMELRSPRRTRPKTPVFAVGQLERASLIRPIDQAQVFAEGYRSILPPRTITPCVERQPPKCTPKTLRKIKCQLSLRDLIKDQARHEPDTSPPLTAYSDAETLVGSESTPTSPTNKGFATEKLPIVAFDKALAAKDNRASLALSDFDNDIGLKICIDLLTNELATVLFRHHPAENQDRASGLQILLMIESYETVQQHVRKQLYDAHVTGRKMTHLQEVERILDHWLQVLYSVYDRSQDRKSNESLRQEDWPLQSLEEEEYYSCDE